MSFFPDPASAPYNMEAEDGETYSLHLDLNFLELQNTINDVLTCLQLIERDDGLIRNGAVHPDAFDTSALALIAGEQNGPTRWIPRGIWVGPGTAYEVTDIVETGSPATSYVCAEAHVSTAVFNTDYAVDHYWVVLSAPRTLISADIVAALGYTPVNRAGDTMTGALIAPTGTIIAGMTFTIGSGFAAINKALYANYTSTSSDAAGAFNADLVRTAGSGYILISNLRGFASTGNVFGFGAQASALSGNTTGVIVPGGLTVASFEPGNTGAKVASSIFFADRLNASDVAGSYSYALASGTLSSAGGGLGSNFYNKGAIAVKIDSQARSSTGEYCGFTRGMKFTEYALDSETDAAYSGSRAYPIGIDFCEMHFYGGADPVIGYNLEAAIALAQQQSILWNRVVGLPGQTNKVRTYWDFISGRWVITGGGIERFGVDTTTGAVYVNGAPFSSVGTGTNNTWTGTNTYTNTVTLGTNLVFSGNGRRITGDMTTATAVNRLSVQTSVAGSATEFQILPSTGGANAGISVFTDPLVASGQFGRISVGASNVLFESGRLGASAFVPLDFNTSGADQMRLDTSGRLLIGTTTAPVTGGRLRVNGLVQIDNPCAFSVNRAGAAFNVVDNVVTAVTWTAEAFDTGAYFDLGTGRFTPPSGYYQISGVCTALGSVDGGQVVLALYKNGSPLHNGSRLSMASGSVVTGSNLSCTIFLNGTDYIDMRVYQANPTATTLSFAGDAVQLHFTGHRVG